MRFELGKYYQLLNEEMVEQCVHIFDDGSVVFADIYRGEYGYSSRFLSVDHSYQKLMKEVQNPRKFVLKAPALVCASREKKHYYITNDVMTEQEAIDCLGPGLVKWPASRALFVEIPIEE